MSDSESIGAQRPAFMQIDALALKRQLRRLAVQADPPWLNSEISRRMVERLSVIKLQPRKVLQWSAFLGASSEELRRAYPEAEWSLVEPVEALRERSLAQLKSARRWFDSLRGRDPTPVLLPQQLKDGDAELLWANMYLHLSPDPQALLRLWQRALAPDGFVMFSCLGPDSLRELRTLYGALAWDSAGPEWIDMHDIGDMLVEAGFADPVMDQERISLTWRDADRMLADLRALGGNLSPDRFAACRTKAWRSGLLRELEALRGPDGLLRLSLELVYGHAFKAPPRAVLSAETRIPLDEMRALMRKPSGSR
ncbi:biotin synthase [Roseateles sp.]|uniref:biotin synthase n=1 Tax=Roseateles sp. TaxID=1971397 RepID=UPI0037C85617